MNNSTNYLSPPTRWRVCLAATILIACGSLTSLAQEEERRPFPPPTPRPSGRMVPEADAGAKIYEAKGIQLPLLSAILPAYEEFIEKKIIVDSSITDAVTMTVNTQQMMTRDEVIRFYEDTFLINGYAILPVDDRTVKFIAVAQNPETSSGHVPVYRDPEDVPDTDDTVGFIMKFQNISAEEGARTLQLYSRSEAADFIAAPDGLTLIITESGRVIRSLLELKEDIDVRRGNLRQEAIQLYRANAEEVADSLNSILQDATSQRQRGRTATPRTAAAPLATSAASQQAAAANQAAAQQQVAAAAAGEIGALPDAENVHIHAVTRTNSLLVIARPVDFAYIKGLIEIFDAKNEIDNFLKRELKYLPVGDFIGLAENALLRYQDGANAEFSSTGGSTGGAGGNSRNTNVNSNNRNSTRNTGSSFGNSRTGGGSSLGGGSTRGSSGGSLGEVGAPEARLVDSTLLIADSQLNNIIVSGPPEHLRIIDQLLDEVDVRPRQVYISAVIAQVTLDDTLSYGMDILRTVDDIEIGGEDVDIAGLFRTTTGGGSILDPNTLQTVADFTQQPDGFSAWASVGNFLNLYVKALEQTTKFKVISRPFVFTRNNQEAFINSGTEVAVPTSTTSTLNGGDSINSSIGYRDITLELAVTPLINSSDEVTLQIEQKNQNIAGTTTISGNTVPNISVQELSTTVRLPNRGIVVLGGIIQEDENDNVTGLPVLSRIPLIKRLTGNTVKEKSRRELLIFIQPHIIEGTTDLIDANIEKVSPTFIGKDAMEVGKPMPEVESSLFPELKKPRRIFKRKQTTAPMDSADNYYEEPALPQSAPPRIEKTTARVTPAGKEEKEKKPRKRLFNFRFKEKGYFQPIK